MGGGSGKKGRFDEQFRFLRKEIDACFRGKGAELCWPFLQPVDPIAMGIPEYSAIIKRPMDLSTIKANLADGIYEDPIEVNQDVKLMLRNCTSFNPPGTAVFDAGKAVESYWASRWRAMPPPPAEVVESESEYEVDSADEGESRCFPGPFRSLSAPYTDNLPFPSLQRLPLSTLISPNSKSVRRRS